MSPLAALVAANVRAKLERDPRFAALTAKGKTTVVLDLEWVAASKERVHAARAKVRVRSGGSRLDSWLVQRAPALDRIRLPPSDPGTQRNSANRTVLVGAGICHS